MPQEKRRPESRPSSKSPDAPINIRPANEALHVTIDHDLYNCNRYYRRLVTCLVAGAVRRVDVLRLHFVCRNGCCCAIDPERTTDYLLEQVWLDNPEMELQASANFARWRNFGRRRAS